MSDIKEKIFETEITSQMGRKFVFSLLPHLENEWFKFTSNLNDLGTNWDVIVRNNTEVMIISDPIVVQNEKYGVMSLTKVLCFGKTKLDGDSLSISPWLPTHTLFSIEI